MVSAISRARNKDQLRTGYTTGACAAAAARAAVKTLITGQNQSSITIRLPVGEFATFTVARTERTLVTGYCVPWSRMQEMTRTAPTVPRSARPSDYSTAPA